MVGWSLAHLHLLEPALRGEHVGTIVRKDATD